MGFQMHFFYILTVLWMLYISDYVTAVTKDKWKIILFSLISYRIFSISAVVLCLTHDYC